MGENNYIIITGATGFLGSHILKYFLKNTNYNVLIIKRSFSDTTRINNELKNQKVRFINIDECNLDSIKLPIKGIIHCATDYGRNNKKSSQVLKANLIFPVELLEFATKRNIELFINMGSYFNKANMSYLYLKDYSLSKKSFNLWLQYFSHKIKIINMQLEHIYGEDDNKEKFVEFAIKNIAIDKADSIDLTHGDQKRDFIYVEDVCSACLKVFNYGLKNHLKYKNFEVGRAEAISVKDLVLLIKELSHSKTKLNFGALPYRDDEIMTSFAENSELLNLGWTPKYDLKSGILKILRKEKMNEKE